MPVRGFHAGGLIEFKLFHAGEQQIKCSCSPPLMNPQFCHISQKPVQTGSCLYNQYNKYTGRNLAQGEM